MANSKEVIYPEIEPSVIGRQMIEKAYSESGYKGEALRLHQIETICYEKITVLRLEFLNILRIDYLWLMPNLTNLGLNGNKIEVIENIEMLTSLTELNLSFNCIEKIANLNTLKNLEILSLFDNMITVIEGLDALNNLLIFSVGNNLIDSLKGIERLRFLKKLNVFNMAGNPVCNALAHPLASYIAAVLPNVSYYEYVYIEDDVRKTAREFFIRELREIETGEEEEIEYRNQRTRELEGEQRLSSSFVEFLNEHQLYQSLWKGDEDGGVLIQIGGQSVEDLLDEYRNDFYAVTQKIYQLGLEKFEERETETSLFSKAVDDAELAAQQSGQRTIEDYILVKDEVFKEATVCLKQIESRSIQGDDEDSPDAVALIEQFEDLSLDFFEKCSNVWQVLMGDELHLHESILESTSFFERNIQEMMSKFIEKTRTYFMQIRDLAVRFSENLLDLVQQYIEEKTSLRDFADVPEGLRVCLEDKDAVMDLIAGMKDHHIQKIDEREDRLVTRSRQFIADLIGGLQRDELERNRSKIFEINSYIEHMTSSFESLQGEIREQLLNENI